MNGEVLKTVKDNVEKVIKKIKSLLSRSRYTDAFELMYELNYIIDKLEDEKEKLVGPSRSRLNKINKDIKLIEEFFKEVDYRRGN